jgi:hypothetical protein
MSSVLFIDHKSSSDDLESCHLYAGSGIANQANNWSDSVLSQSNGVSDNSGGLRESHEWSQQEPKTSGTIPNNFPRYGCTVSDSGDRRHASRKTSQRFHHNIYK